MSGGGRHEMREELRRRGSWSGVPGRSNIAMPLGLFVMLLIWQGIVMLFGIHPVILPSPLAVMKAMWEERQTLIRGGAITGASAGMGLLASTILGTMIAIVFSQSNLIRRVFYPYVIFLQTVPIVAVAPLLIVWSGYTMRSVVLASFIVSLFPIVSNVTAGLTSVDRNLRDLFRLYGASRWQGLIKLRIPAAVPSIILGMRISSGLSVIGAIVGEFVVGNSVSSYAGLGVVMTGWQGLLKTDALIGAILVSTFLGIVMFNMVNLLSRTLLRRWTVGAGFEAE